MAVDVGGIEFLEDCTNEQLSVLVKIIREKGSLTELLSQDETYRKDPSNPRAYVYPIQRELIEFGSNTLGSNKTYKQILIDVCRKSDASGYTTSDSIEKIETSLLAKISANMWDKMSSNERKALLQSLNDEGKSATELLGKQGGSAAFTAIFQMGGFASYQWSVIIANSVAKMFLKRGLSLVANAGLTKALSIATGPIGAALMALWTIWDIAGPAYRVTVPSVTYIAALRRIYRNG